MTHWDLDSDVSARTVKPGNELSLSHSRNYTEDKPLGIGVKITHFSAELTGKGHKNASTLLAKMNAL